LRSCLPFQLLAGPPARGWQHCRFRAPPARGHPQRRPPPPPTAAGAYTRPARAWRSGTLGLRRPVWDVPLTLTPRRQVAPAAAAAPRPHPNARHPDRGRPRPTSRGACTPTPVAPPRRPPPLPHEGGCGAAAAG